MRCVSVNWPQSTNCGREGRYGGVIDDALAVLLVLALCLLGLATVLDLAARMARHALPARDFWTSMFLGLGTVTLLNVVVRLR
jgi:hypothetical protein